VRRIVRELGRDKCGKAWKVLVTDKGRHGITEKNRVYFYVFPRNTHRSNLRWDGPHTFLASLERQPSNDEGVFLDICHSDYESDSFLERLSSLSPRLGGIESSPTRRKVSGTAKWQNRGIGTLLAKFVEEWAIESGIKRLVGFVNPKDDIEKLKVFWPRLGWSLEFFDEEEYKRQGSHYIGKGTKQLCEAGCGIMAERVKSR